MSRLKAGMHSGLNRKRSRSEDPGSFRVEFIIARPCRCRRPCAVTEIRSTRYCQLQGGEHGADECLAQAKPGMPGRRAAACPPLCLPTHTLGVQNRWPLLLNRCRLRLLCWLYFRCRAAQYPAREAFAPFPNHIKQDVNRGQKHQADYRGKQ